jgi:hypothetical protein
MNARPNDPQSNDGTNDQREPAFAVGALRQSTKSATFSAQQLFK